MKSFIVSCMVIFAAQALAQFGNNQYSDRFNVANTGMDDVVVVSRRLKPFVECILDFQKCSPATKKMQARARREMEKECSQCRRPKQGARRDYEDLNNSRQAFLYYITPKDYDHREYEEEPRHDRD